MTINNQARASSRRGKRSSKADSPETENKTAEAKAMSAENPVDQDPSETNKDESMASDNVVKISARPAQADAQEKARCNSTA
ncbi:hypothetical protein K9N68_28485 [Kovacikia minuta CCNUW1]|uniref:hypothetical protein n=1 Tax=Kovacikia minuta TaxID=2931930 RepID=UPI001CCD0645|nr:hypothetical protein [Kovacikia minuta]UBF25479.1 hypothetical protein K9N68_28485 [Kovacikia minuta CCNUW1]